MADPPAAVGPLRSRPGRYTPLHETPSAHATREGWVTALKDIKETPNQCADCSRTLSTELLIKTQLCGLARRRPSLARERVLADATLRPILHGLILQRRANEKRWMSCRPFLHRGDGVLRCRELRRSLVCSADSLMHVLRTLHVKSNKRRASSMCALGSSLTSNGSGHLWNLTFCQSKVSEPCSNLS